MNNYFAMPMRYESRDTTMKIIDTGERRFLVMRACVIPDGQVVVVDMIRRVAMRYKNGVLVLRYEEGGSDSEKIRIRARSRQWIEVLQESVKPSPHRRKKI